MCSSHSIREDVLDAAVLATIQNYISVIMDMDRALEDVEALSWERSAARKLEADIEFQQQVIETNNDLILGMYEDLRGGILTRDEFVSMKAEFSDRIHEAERIIEQLKSDRDNIRQGLTNQQGWLKQFLKFKNISEINRVEIVSLVERINIRKDAEIDIVFRQKNRLADIMDFLDEQNKLKNQSKVITLPQMEVI